MVDKYKYLEMVLDPLLRFDKHIRYIKGKVVGWLCMLFKFRPVSKENSCPTLYKTLVIPILDYAHTIYDCLTKCDTETLQKQKLQNQYLK